MRQTKLHNRPKAGGRQPCEWALPPGAQARAAVDFCSPLEIIEGGKKNVFRIKRMETTPRQ